MLKSLIKLYKPASLHHINANSLRTFCNKNEKWDLMSAVCLQRRPIITKELNEIELKFSKLLTDIEFENSLLSDHELRKIMDQLQSKQPQSDDIIRQNAHDFEDSSLEEFNKFNFASRKTEADEKNDLKSLERNLDRDLFLIVHNEKVKNWCLPQSVRQDGETMRQAAERSLQESCGQIKAQFYGNAPSGFYKYNYPKELQQKGLTGAKIFFYLATYLAGDINLDNNHTDYKWLTQEELKSSLVPEYHKSISQFLITDSL